MNKKMTIASLVGVVFILLLSISPFIFGAWVIIKLLQHFGII